jgi:hypothetical protein
VPGPSVRLQHPQDRFGVDELRPIQALQPGRPVDDERGHMETSGY